jgi:hypothetical protein
MLMSSCALSGLSPFAYPRPWDYARQKPEAAAALVGTYRLHKLSRSPSGVDSNGDYQVLLSSDGSAQLQKIPQFDGFGETKLCEFSATGKWNVFDGGWGNIQLSISQIFEKQQRGTCPPSSNIDFLILGQSAPYRLYLGFGDPDEDTGMEFARVESTKP